MRDFNHIISRSLLCKAFVCLFFLFFIGIPQTNAQRIVKGTVTDETGEPLIGASILIKGTGHGAVTDMNGR